MSNAEAAVALLTKLAGMTLGAAPIANIKPLKNMSQPLTIAKKSTNQLAKPPQPPKTIAAASMKPKAANKMAANPPKPVDPATKPGGAVNPGRNVVS